MINKIEIIIKIFNVLKNACKTKPLTNIVLLLLTISTVYLQYEVYNLTAKMKAFEIIYEKHYNLFNYTKQQTTYYKREIKAITLKKNKNSFYIIDIIGFDKNKLTALSSFQELIHMSFKDPFSSKDFKNHFYKIKQINYNPINCYLYETRDDFKKLFFANYAYMCQAGFGYMYGFLYNELPSIDYEKEDSNKLENIFNN